jgi:hypothetical protein
MPLSAGTTANGTEKFRRTRTNKNQTNKHRRLAAMKIFIKFSRRGDRVTARQLVTRTASTPIK